MKCGLEGTYLGRRYDSIHGVNFWWAQAATIISGRFVVWERVCIRRWDGHMNP